MKKILILLSAILISFFLWINNPADIVDIYGTREFEGANIYINHDHLGVMAWDGENNRTYAKDLDLLEHFSFYPGLYKYGSKRDSVKIRPWDRSGEIEIRAVTKEGLVYVKRFKNMEDLAYTSYNLKSFQLER